MHTNLFLVLRDALAWVAAHDGATLSLSLASDLVVKVQVPSGTAEPGESASWSIPHLDLLKSYASDVVPLPAAAAVQPAVPLGDRIGAELRAYISKPLGLLALPKVLLAADHPVTVAVLARAAALQAQIDAGTGIDHYFPEPPTREPIVPKVNFFDLLRGQ